MCGASEKASFMGHETLEVCNEREHVNAEVRLRAQKKLNPTICNFQCWRSRQTGHEELARIPARNISACEWSALFLKLLSSKVWLQADSDKGFVFSEGLCLHLLTIRPAGDYKGIMGVPFC